MITQKRITADFNPRSPRGGATIISVDKAKGSDISIHAPHEGERRILPAISMRPIYFNPRSPRGGATEAVDMPSGDKWISIHAPHEGERLFGTAEDGVPVLFQSTLPTRGSDALYASCRRWRSSFQSTLPTRGSDHAELIMACTSNYFNPRSPRGGATSDQCA